MTRVAYFDCFSGASGDMLLGALLDSGLELDVLREGLSTLGVGGYELQVTPAQQHGITGSHFEVVDVAGERPVRNLPLIREILEKAALPEGVTARSLEVFTRLGEAEARIHGVALEQVHFHEVGAIDTLVDIVGFCLAMDHLGIDEVFASPLPLGSGTVRTEHGLLPVPAPATLALLAQAGAPTVPLDSGSELVTPTGAALLTTLATFSCPAMHVQQVGYGFGTKTFPWANMLRVWIGEALPAAHRARAMQGHTHSHTDAHAHTHAHEHAHPHEHEHEHTHEGESVSDTPAASG